MLLVSRIGSVESEMNVLLNLTHLSLEAEMNMVISFAVYLNYWITNTSKFGLDSDVPIKKTSYWLKNAWKNQTEFLSVVIIILPNICENMCTFIYTFINIDPQCFYVWGHL
jgi:hypothetical protein